MSIAGMSYLQLQQEVLSFQFSENYRELIKRWLNTAQRKAVQQSEFRTQEEVKAFTTAASDATLELPADFSRWIDFYDTGSKWPLTPLEKAEYDALEGSSGRPTAYTVVGNQITLWPTPDAAYSLSLRYWRLPADMVADGDEPEIPAQYHEILVAYAMQKAYARENDYTSSRFWKEEWEAGVAKIRGEVQADTFSGPKQVGGSWNGDSVFPVVRVFGG
jgi:hypothetical protein